MTVAHSLVVVIAQHPPCDRLCGPQLSIVILAQHPLCDSHCGPKLSCGYNFTSAHIHLRVKRFIPSPLCLPWSPLHGYQAHWAMPYTQRTQNQHLLHQEMNEGAENETWLLGTRSRPSRVCCLQPLSASLPSTPNRTDQLDRAGCRATSLLSLLPVRAFQHASFLGQVSLETD